MQLVALLADRGPVELQWHAPATCPDGAHVAARIDALLGSSDAQAPATIAVVDVSETAGRFSALVRLGGAAGSTTRTIDGAACATVADAVALVVAVHVDVLAVGDATELDAARAPDVPEPRGTTPRGDPAPRDPAITTPRVRPAAPARPAATPPRARPAIRGALRVGGAASFRALPGIAAPVVGLGGALLIGRARVQLDLGWQLERTHRLPAPDDEAGTDIGLLAATLRGGWVPRVRTVEFPLLAGVELGDMTARGFGLSGARRQHGAWVAALVGAGVAWVPLRSFALVLDPAVVFGLARQRFGVGDGGTVREVYRAKAVGARIGIAIEVRLP